MTLFDSLKPVFFFTLRLLLFKAVYISNNDSKMLHSPRFLTLPHSIYLVQ